MNICFYQGYWTGRACPCMTTDRIFYQKSNIMDKFIILLELFLCMQMSVPHNLARMVEAALKGTPGLPVNARMDLMVPTVKYVSLL